ncbi:MAG TPA: hypothetical protein VFA65_05030 [Bryobacteraceae bacterium]|nr:hypothetical protein [Bryobacteraceae bacterium]
MHFDTALNLVWLLLGATALATTIRAAIHRDRTNRTPTWLHIVGVALIVAALFPYISATDDLVRSETLSTQQDQSHSSSGSKAPNNNLIRLFETLDSPLACETCTLTLTLLAVWVIFIPAATRDGRVAPSYAGRSPPRPLGV